MVRDVKRYTTSVEVTCLYSEEQQYGGRTPSVFSFGCDGDNY